MAHGVDVRGAGADDAEAALAPHRQPPVLVLRAAPVLVRLLVRQRGKHEAVGRRWAVEEGDRGQGRGHGPEG